MPSKKSSSWHSFKWDVQPYRWLYELRDAYTRGVAFTTKKGAEEMAAEATAWMKSNAPWKDDTGVARDSLLAFVEEGPQMATVMAPDPVGFAKAKSMDAQLLSQLNTERQAEALSRSMATAERTIEKFNLSGEEAREMRERVRGTRVIPMASVPAEHSHVAAFRRAEASRASQAQAQSSFLVKIIFTYNLSQEDYPYIIWLEIANGGRFSILGPAYAYWSKKWLIRLKRIANLKNFQGTFDVPSAPEMLTNAAGVFARHAEQGRRDASGNLKSDLAYEPFSSAVHREKQYGRKYRRSKAKARATGVKRKRTSRKQGGS